MAAREVELDDKQLSGREEGKAPNTEKETSDVY